MDFANIENGTLVKTFDVGLEGAARPQATDVFPLFRREAIKNEVKSLEAGRPIYDTVEMIQIIIPGDPGNSPIRTVREKDKVRFAAAYERFKREEEVSFDGTPVDAWPRLEVRQVYALKNMGFFTVESIAAVSDGNLHRLGMGGMMLRDMAKAYVEASKTGGVPERLVVENAQLRTDMDGMRKTIEALTFQIEKLAKEKPASERAKVEAEFSRAVSHTQEVVEKRPGALPDGWREYKTNDLIKLCQAMDFAVTPRTKDEAIKLLEQHEGLRAAAKA